MLTALLIIIILLLLSGAAAGYYFFCLALKRSTDKHAALKALPKNERSETQKKAPAFLESVKTQEWELLSFDGLKLSALFIENSGDKWVIIQHGYMSRVKAMDKLANFLYSEGFNVLLPHARAHGDSEGDYIGMGWLDRLDLLKWLDKISASRPNCRILLYGVSMGASAMMMLSGEKLPSQVEGIIEDCGFCSIWEECRHQLTNIFHVPSFVAEYILHWSNLFVRIFAKYDLRDGDATECLRRETLPFVFIHGSADSFVPFYMLSKAYEAAGTSDKEIHCFEKAEHGRSEASDPVRYRKILKDFISKVFDQSNSKPIGQ